MTRAHQTAQLLIKYEYIVAHPYTSLPLRAHSLRTFGLGSVSKNVRDPFFYNAPECPIAASAGTNVANKEARCIWLENVTHAVTSRRASRHACIAQCQSANHSMFRGVSSLACFTALISDWPSLCIVGKHNRGKFVFLEFRRDKADLT